VVDGDPVPKRRLAPEFAVVLLQDDAVIVVREDVVRADAVCPARRLEEVLPPSTASSRDCRWSPANGPRPLTWDAISSARISPYGPRSPRAKPSYARRNASSLAFGVSASSYPIVNEP
jgi:hypothetical protein